MISLIKIQAVFILIWLISAKICIGSNLFVYHISKCGGSTLCQNFLKMAPTKFDSFQRKHNCNINELGPSIIKNCSDDARTCAVIKKRIQQNQNHILFSEVPLPPPECIGDNVTSIIQLREPIARILSHLNHIDIHEDTIHDSTLHVFNLSNTHFFHLPTDSCMHKIGRRYPLLDNYFIRMLLGFEVFQLPFNEIDERHLELAKERLRHFSAVFFLDQTKRPTSSIYQFVEKSLNLKKHITRPQIYNQRKYKNYYSSDFIQLLKIQNRLDSRLYQWLLQNNTGQTVATTSHGSSQQILYMLGDSTIRQQFELLCEEEGAPIVQKQGTHAFKYKECVVPHLRVLLPNNYADWGNPTVKSTASFAKYFASRTNTTPSVIYFNGALHYLQLIPYRQWDIDDKDAYLTWFNAEEIVKHFVNDTIRAFPNSKIVFMTSHSICEDKFTGNYKKALVEIKRNATQFASPCVAFLEQKRVCESRQSCLKACLESTFNDRGVWLINQRVLAVLPASVKVVDAWNLTKGQCIHTRPSDGRHYDKFIRKQEINRIKRLIFEQ